MLFLLNGIFQLLTLLVLGSTSCETCFAGIWGGGQDDFECDATCQVTTGGVIAIVTSHSWFIAGALCFRVRDALDDDIDHCEYDYSTTRTQNQHQHSNTTTIRQSQVLAVTSCSNTTEAKIEVRPIMPSAVATETTTQHVEADVTTVVENMTCNADGTTTVTTTVTTTKIPPATATTTTASLDSVLADKGMIM